MTVFDALADRHEDHRPLLSSRFLCGVAAVTFGLAALTAGITLAGRWYGEYLARAGHTDSRKAFDLFIGEDHLRLSANTIRFADQRRTSIAQRVDLYLTWPEMEGYSDARRVRFNDVSDPSSLVFLQISQSTMSRDMSGRLEPIYRHIFAGAPAKGPAGLVMHATAQSSGYGQEVFFTGDRAQGNSYVVRCLLPVEPAASTSADCQRDIHAGADLVVLYRFSSQLLPQWQAIDDAVANYVKARLAP